jgi:hypothetical protein
MSTRKPTLEDLARIEELAARWGKIVVKEHWGEAGPGLDVTLDQMEQVAMAAVRGLLAGTLQIATADQADRLGQEHACPDCGHVCPLTCEPRQVTTGIGSFEHREPTGHCPACRRDFFPSAPALGADQPRL